MPETMTEAERTRRREFMRDNRSALAAGLSLDQLIAKREACAAGWAAWLHAKMNELHVDDPAAIFPLALAQVEENAIAEARRAAETAAKETVAKMLRKVIA
jgi:hypothetical protein